MKIDETVTAMISATTTDIQIPLISKNVGRIRTELVSKIKVRRNETAAEIFPLLSAVKNAEVKTENPDSRNANEKIRNA